MGCEGPAPPVSFRVSYLLGSHSCLTEWLGPGTQRVASWGGQPAPRVGVGCWAVFPPAKVAWAAALGNRKR